MSKDGNRELVEKFKINDWEIAASVVKALRADGYEIEIAPGFKLTGACGEPEPSGRIITVYRKGVRHDS